ncbi:Integrase [Salmonella enterica subsp. enterica]|uniref:Integrase n=1 Tax=Salmonella enterica I TaxID=59201 RepID=A0A447MZ35_SALET|nr:Integrase [Salmonella enterica subsp. enterica]
MKLNARQVETAKPKDKTYKMADGGGLYLEVSAKGSKYWRMKYRRPSDKKEDRLAFGVWPTVTLAQARAKRDEAKKLLAQGIDPKAEQKEAQAENSGHILSKLSLVNGMLVISAGVKITDHAFYVILSFISFLILVRLTSVSSKLATC